MPEDGRTCDSETLVGAPSSSSPDVSMQQNQEEDVSVRRENGEADTKSNKSAGSTATGQSNEDDMGDSDSTSGLDSEVIIVIIQTNVPFDQQNVVQSEICCPKRRQSTS